MTEQFETIDNPLDNPAAEQPIERTDLDKLKEIFEQYATMAEAKKHVNEVAEGKNKFNQTFSKPNCYKAINRKCHFKGDAGKIVSHEATAKIGEGQDMAISQEATVEATAEASAAPTEPPSETPSMPYGSYEATKAELQPIQERSVKGIIDNVFSIAGLKGDGKNEGEAFLTDQESKDTVVLIPYILKKVMKTDMTQDNYETLTIGLHATNIISKVAKKRIEKGRMFKEEKPEAKTEVPPVGIPTPTETPPTEQPTSQIATETPPSIDEQTTAFKKRLG